MDILIKILLIIIIIILVIILLLVLLGIFKIKYNFKISREDKCFKYNINVNYLLKCVQLILDSEQKKHMQIRLFGINLLKDNKKSIDNDENIDIIDEEEIIDEVNNQKNNNIFSKVIKRKYFNLYSNDENVTNEISKKLLSQSKKVSKLVKKEKKPFSLKVFIHNVKVKFKYFTSKETHEFIKLLYKELKKILGYILPKRLNAKIDIGLKDPFLLGTTLSFFSFIYKKFGENLKVTPHFNEKIFTGDIEGDGEIRLIILILIFIKLLFNRRFRQMIFSKKS